MPTAPHRLTPFLEFTPSASERALLTTMSAESTPIPAARFAAALEHLSVGSLHLKAAEIRNSLAHLRSSNVQLAEFAAAGDPDCADALRENQDVIVRYDARIAMLKAEVEKRGLPWVEDDPTVRDPAEPGEEGSADRRAQGRQTNGAAGGSGSIGDEELARRLRERMEPHDADDQAQDGVHL